MGFDWVFYGTLLVDGAREKLANASCGLEATMTKLQELYDSEADSTAAFSKVFSEYPSLGKGAPCKDTAGDACDDICGEDRYCSKAEAVVLFCGEGGLEACDPSQFLCLTEDGEPQVGYVREYLYLFLDMVVPFQGNGCSTGSPGKGCEEEFILVPNPEIPTPSTLAIQVRELADMSTDQCAPSN